MCIASFPLSDFENTIVFFFFFPDNFPPVRDVTVTSVGPSSISIRWTVSFNSGLISSATLYSHVTTQRYTSFPRGASSNQLEVAYGYNSGVRRVTAVSGSLTEYTLTNLEFEREYSISIRARVRYSRNYYYYCSSYLYGDYSSEVRARTMESGKDVDCT